MPIAGNISTLDYIVIWKKVIKIYLKKCPKSVENIETDPTTSPEWGMTIFSYSRLELWNGPAGRAKTKADSLSKLITGQSKIRTHFPSPKNLFQHTKMSEISPRAKWVGSGEIYTNWKHGEKTRYKKTKKHKLSQELVLISSPRQCGVTLTSKKNHLLINEERSSRQTNLGEKKTFATGEWHCTLRSFRKRPNGWTTTYKHTKEKGF
jgi:hypothetical protein